MRRFFGGLITGAILTATVVIGYNVLAGNVVDTNVHEVRTGETWAQIAAAHGYVQLAPGSSTDSVVNTPADQLQVFNDHSATTSDSALPRVGRGLLVHSSPPSTSSPSTTTSTVAPPPSSSTTTTSDPPSTSTSTTSAPTTTTASTTTVAPATTIPTPGTLFSEDFSTEASVDRFNVELFTGQHGNLNVDWLGDHDMNCAGPNTTRFVDGSEHHTGSDPSALVWWCAPDGADTGHFMTSVNTIGNAVLSFSPDESFTNLHRVCWNVNATHLGSRKWMATAIIPEAAYQASAPRLDFLDPVGQGLSDQTSLRLPDGSVHVTDGDENGAISIGTPDGLGVEIFRDDSYGLTADVATRYRRCITDNGNGTISVFADHPPGRRDETWTVAARFPDGPVRIIFQDLNYDPPKAPREIPTGGAGFTWHWDSIIIESE